MIAFACEIANLVVFNCAIVCSRAMTCSSFRRIFIEEFKARCKKNQAGKNGQGTQNLAWSLSLCVWLQIEKEYLMEIFNQLDRQGTGRLTFKQLREALRRMHMNFSVGALLQVRG